MRETFTPGSVLGRAPGNRCLYPEADALQRPLRSRFQARLSRSVRRSAWRVKTTEKESSMYSDADRAKIVQAEAKRLEHFLGALSPEDWQRPSACDRWHIADVVAHLTGMRVAYTITRGLQGDITPP